ncbi:MAG: DUF4245 domain-containing protein [Mycobacteriales bacterium]
MTQTEPEPAAPPKLPRRQPRLTDMAISLGVLLAIIAVVLFAQQRSGDKAVKVIDPSQAYAGARNVATYRVLTPQGLPGGWRPTSARTESPETGRLTLRVGFVTPKAEYAQLVESDLPRAQLLTAELAAGARPTGSVEVGDAQWLSYPAANPGDRVIVRSSGGVTYVVSGSAGLAELRTLAGSLR